ncbi:MULTISPECIES: RNA polymerase sigma factor [Paenibacillus]|uniref:RNA polymerase sigma factor n=1 Tax=Paenibacillus TaxID=44249 RepID=UPI002FE09565
MREEQPLEGVVSSPDAYIDRITLHHQALRQYCRALAGSPWEGDDLVQDTWLKVWSALQRGVQENRITRAYLYRVARNAWIDRNRKKTLPLVEQPLEELQHPNADPMEVWMAMEILVQQLAPGQRTAFLLVDVLKYTAAEAAELTRSSEGAIKAALHRARAKLKKRVEDKVGDQKPAQAKSLTPLPYKQVMGGATDKGKNPNTPIAKHSDSIRKRQSEIEAADTSKSEADALRTYAYVEAFRQQNTAAMVMLMNDGVPKEAVVSVLHTKARTQQNAHWTANLAANRELYCRAAAA